MRKSNARLEGKFAAWKKAGEGKRKKEAGPLWRSSCSSSVPFPCPVVGARWDLLGTSPRSIKELCKSRKRKIPSSLYPALTTSQQPFSSSLIPKNYPSGICLNPSGFGSEPLAPARSCEGSSCGCSEQTFPTLQLPGQKGEVMKFLG